MKVVFLDRDGVINKYPGDRLYVTSLRKFRFLPRAKEAIALLSGAGFKVFVASNQAGVGKGIYSQKILDAITVKMLTDINEAGGRIDRVYYCTHRKEAGCPCRKPKPGLLKKAAREFKVNLKKAYFVGDTIRDVLTAHAVGAKSILILSGKEKLSNQRNWEAKPDFVFKDLLEAAKFLK
ncbi:MAG: HAD-IIIA family hydrolase [Candidatus Omnitrophica bacterium]|nr:HAD-IIIA family hydrolase [Candidatus Omnitrophota bacterium]MBU4303642.1 HAD-IIIA family hydrolase [Candidatus Omnitrophota bacterium]MBU4418563.1 HAD-IIIA family hydrolase [Candidatus Omnitrophota bacterium]MBU4467236.1 HAD-IIIA family hydrolase [Candidatus Omnitrophota bacterium]MCG2707636.1 HAD-IIIA family hydrolase [Candidatus Omnitrophota bacterium]